MILRDDVQPYNSLYHLSLQWARSDDTNFTFDEFVRFLNVALNRLQAVIMRHDQDWKYRDRNAAPGSLIDATTDLVANQSAYPIALHWLKIARVRVKDEQGNYHTIHNVDRYDVADWQFGNPCIRGYYLLGNTLYLVGTPTYGYAAGIEVQYQQGATHFTPADAAKTVGFDPTFEEAAALMPALDYLDINGPEEQAVKVRTRIGTEPRQGAEGSGLLNALALSYQQRDDTPKRLSLRRNNRAIGTL